MFEPPEEHAEVPADRLFAAGSSRARPTPGAAATAPVERDGEPAADSPRREVEPVDARRGSRLIAVRRRRHIHRPSGERSSAPAQFTGRSLQRREPASPTVRHRSQAPTHAAGRTPFPARTTSEDGSITVATTRSRRTAGGCSPVRGGRAERNPLRSRSPTTSPLVVVATKTPPAARTWPVIRPATAPRTAVQREAGYRDPMLRRASRAGPRTSVHVGAAATTAPEDRGGAEIALTPPVLQTNLGCSLPAFTPERSLTSMNDDPSTGRRQRPIIPPPPARSRSARHSRLDHERPLGTARVPTISRHQDRAGRAPRRPQLATLACVLQGGAHRRRLR